MLKKLRVFKAILILAFSLTAINQTAGKVNSFAKLESSKKEKRYLISNFGAVGDNKPLLDIKFKNCKVTAKKKSGGRTRPPDRFFGTEING